MVIRREEAFCQGAFTAYLREHQGITDADWVPEPNGKTTPPDFYLRIGERTRAVEVTALMTHYEQSSGRRISEEGIWKSTEQLADEVECEAAAQGVLRGFYVLRLDGPYDSFRSSRNEIRKALSDFISGTQDLAKVPMEPKPLVSPSGQRYSLQKVSIKRNAVCIATLPDDGEWESGVVTELYSLVEDALVSKVRKLWAVPPPWVLLLLDRHHLATPREYAKVQDRLCGSARTSLPLDEFHSIYIVDQQSQVCRLYPRDGGDWVG